MRLFISCHLPEGVLSYLQELVRDLPPASLVVPKAFDLTMKFLGEVHESNLSLLQKKLSEIVFPPFEAEFDRIGVFSEEHIRVVWLGPKEVDHFLTLHKMIDRALSPSFPEDPRFYPHITLARVKSIKDRKKFLLSLDDISVKPQQVLIDKLLLVKSTLTSSGATHEILNEFSLQQMNHT